MENPLVTILTPVYNHENYLEEYFQSIIDQSYENIELILIDDASSDDSKKIIDNWMEKITQRFIRVEYINRPVNKGLIVNLNEGLQIAEGKYMYLIASDDFMYPRNIEKKVEYLENNPEFAFVHSASYTGQVFHKGKKNKVIGLNGKSGLIFNELIKGNKILAPTVLVKRESLLEAGGYNEEWGFEDYPMWLEITYKQPIGFINEPLVFYRTSPNSLSRGIENFISMIDKQELILKDWNKRVGIDINESLENVNIMAAKFFFIKNDYKRYKIYRKKIKNRSIKIIAMDFFVRLCIPSTVLYNLVNLFRK